MVPGRGHGGWPVAGKVVRWAGSSERWTRPRRAWTGRGWRGSTGHFARYVDDWPRRPGARAGSSRSAWTGRLAHVSCYGSRDIEAGLPVEPDTLWRIYDDQAGHLGRRDDARPGRRVRAHRPGQRLHPLVRRRPRRRLDLRPVTYPATEPVRIWHRPTHTSGLTYAFHRVHPVDAMYRAAGFEWASPPGMDLAQACDVWAGLPLLFHGLGVERPRVIVPRPGHRGRIRAGPRRVLLRPGSCARWACPICPAPGDAYVKPRLAALYTPGAVSEGGQAGCPGQRGQGAAGR